MSKLSRSVLFLLALVMVSGLAAAQVDVTSGPAVATASPHLAIDERADGYDVRLNGGFPSNYAFMFLSYAAGPWFLDFGPAIGSVNLGVYQPGIDFILGQTDITGGLKTGLPKPASLTPDLVGAVLHAQVVSVAVVASGPDYMFQFAPSDVASFVLSSPVITDVAASPEMPAPDQPKSVPVPQKAAPLESPVVVDQPKSVPVAHKPATLESPVVADQPKSVPVAQKSAPVELPPVADQPKSVPVAQKPAPVELPPVADQPKSVPVGQKAAPLESPVAPDQPKARPGPEKPQEPKVAVAPAPPVAADKE